MQCMAKADNMRHGVHLVAVIDVRFMYCELIESCCCLTSSLLQAEIVHVKDNINRDIHLTA